MQVRLKYHNAVDLEIRKLAIWIEIITESGSEWCIKSKVIYDNPASERHLREADHDVFVSAGYTCSASVREGVGRIYLTMQ